MAYTSSVENLFLFQEDGLSDKILESPDKDKMLETLAMSLSMIHKSRSIDFVSGPFFEKVTNEKIFEKLVDLFCEIEDCEGVLLYPKSKFSQIHAVSYVINIHEGKLLLELHLYNHSGRVGIIYATVSKNKGRTEWVAVLSNSLKGVSDEQIKTWMINHTQTCLAVLTFKQFAEIETIEIGGSKPKRVKIGSEKYLNESNQQVNVLDSRWFTNIIRTEGFKVSGHFRLQAYGEGMKKRKLIYISEFMKSGYSTKAKHKSGL